MSPKEMQVDNVLSIYINKREPKSEKPHVHATLGSKGRTNDVKINIKTREVVESKGVWKAKDLKWIKEIVEGSEAFLLARWAFHHGKPLARKAKKKAKKK